MKLRDGEEMTLKHSLYMTPIEKYRIYGIFPWPLVISVMLTFLTSLQVISIVSISTNYSYNQIIQWNNLFLNQDVGGSDTTLVNSYNILNIPDLKTYVYQTVFVSFMQNYNNVNNLTMDKYYYIDQVDGLPAVKMYVNYVNRNEASQRGFQSYYLLTPDDLGPFNNNPKDFIDLLDSFELDFSLGHTLDDSVPTFSTCYTWTIIQTYNYIMHGPITASLSFERGICNNEYCIFYLVDVFAKYFWLNCLVLALAITELIFTVSSTYKRAIEVTKMSVKRTKTSAVWANLNFQEKIKFINLWIIFSTIGNVCQILSCANMIIVGNVVLSVNETVIGIGCFCSWISVIQYLKSSRDSYTVIDTLSRAFSRLWPYVFGVLPIFMGFVFLAMCLFWKTGNYSSVSASMIIAFAMLNGDSLYPLMSDAINVSGFIGQIYMYGFLLFFICVVQNIFIAIIIDGFQSLKIKPVNKTGLDEDEDENAANPSNQSLNFSLQKNPSIKDKSIKRQKSLAIFKNLLMNPTNQKTDKTNEYIEQLEICYKALCKKINHLFHLLNTTEKGVDKSKLKDRIDEFFDKEIDEMVEIYLAS